MINILSITEGHSPFRDLNIPWDDMFSFILLPLAIVFVVSFIIGLERQNVGKAAGISAHVLVGLSTASIAIMQRFMLFEHILTGEQVMSEGQRIIAQVITGVGFIGAGVILKDHGNIIRGITTAATIWTVAMIGILLGSGYIVLGSILSVVILIFMISRDLKRGINPLKDHTAKEALHKEGHHL